MSRLEYYTTPTSTLPGPTDAEHSVQFDRLRRTAVAASAGLELRHGVIAAQVKVSGPPEALRINVTCRLRTHADPQAIAEAIETCLIPRLEADHRLRFASHYINIQTSVSDGDMDA